MPYIEYLKRLKEDRKLTQAQIAELSGIPLATISRLLHGTTASPTLDTLTPVVIALGGSLDEMMGLKIPDDVPVAPQVETTMTAYADLLHEKELLLKEKELRINEKDETIRVLRESLKLERLERRRTLRIFAVVIFLMLTFIVVDVLNGHFGYFKY